MTDADLADLMRALTHLEVMRPYYATLCARVRALVGESRAALRADHERIMAAVRETFRDRPEVVRALSSIVHAGDPAVQMRCAEAPSQLNPENTP